MVKTMGSGTAKRQRPVKPTVPEPPARSNKGGAVRGQARAAQVKAMNADRKSGQRKAAPAAAVKKRAKASTSAERAAAQNRREVYASLAENKKAAASSAPKSSARKPADLKDYAGNPVKFLGDFFTGGAFRK